MKKPFLTRMDPRTKGFSLVLASILVVASSDWRQLAGVTLLIAAAVPASGARIVELLGRLRLVFWFVLIIVGLNAVTVSGYVLVSAGSIYVTSEGILAGLLLSVRIVLLLWASSIFLWCTPTLDLLDGLEASLRFLRLPTGPAIMAVSIALNSVPLLIQSARRVRSAQLARGVDDAPGFIAQISNTSMMALPLFAAVFRGADQLADAMDSRCYEVSRARSQYRKLELGFADWCLLSGVAMFTILFFQFA